MKTFVCTLFIFVTNFIAASEPNSIVVMLGDSTTDQGLPWVVLKELNQKLKIPLSRKRMINAGKGGDNATSALRRLELDVLAHKPNIVTVSFGLNDTGGRKPKEYGQSVRKIVRALKAANINVILMTSTPFNNQRHFWAKQKEFQKMGGLDEYMDREFCEQVRTISKEENVLLCDLHKIFKAKFKQDSEAINRLISRDGVHLTGEGLNLMAQQIAPLLEQLINQKKGNTVAE